MSHCKDCGDGGWECGKGECGSGGGGGGGGIEWTVCGNAYLPTPIGLRYGVRVLAGIEKIGGTQHVRVRLIPLDQCTPTKKCSPVQLAGEAAAAEPCPDDS